MEGLHCKIEQKVDELLAELENLLGLIECSSVKRDLGGNTVLSGGQAGQGGCPVQGSNIGMFWIRNRGGASRQIETRLSVSWNCKGGGHALRTRTKQNATDAEPTPTVSHPGS